jgi:hypothetical protein
LHEILIHSNRNIYIENWINDKKRWRNIFWQILF